jgi:hypothetical protein
MTFDQKKVLRYLYLHPIPIPMWEHLGERELYWRILSRSLRLGKRLSDIVEELTCQGWLDHGFDNWGHVTVNTVEQAAELQELLAKEEE